MPEPCVEALSPSPFPSATNSPPGTIDATSYACAPPWCSRLLSCRRGVAQAQSIERANPSCSPRAAVDRAGEGQVQRTGAPEGAAAANSKVPPPRRNPRRRRRQAVHRRAGAFYTPTRQGASRAEGGPSAQPLPPGPPPAGKSVRATDPQGDRAALREEESAEGDTDEAGPAQVGRSGSANPARGHRNAAGSKVPPQGTAPPPKGTGPPGPPPGPVVPPR